MKFLNGLIRFVLFIIWAFIIFYLGKALGMDYDPENASAGRNMARVISIVLILGGAYFIRKLEFFRKKEED